MIFESVNETNEHFFRSCVFFAIRSSKKMQLKRGKTCMALSFQVDLYFRYRIGMKKIAIEIVPHAQCNIQYDKF